MFGRIARGWRITKRSFQIIKQDKEILVFPILETMFYILVSGIFVLLAFSFGIVSSIINNNFSNMLIYVLFLIYIYSLYLAGIFFEGAIVSSASIRLSGKNPSLRDGLSLPLKKTGKLFLWALIAMIVGIILNFLANLGKGRGRGFNIASKAGAAGLGIAWNLTTLLIIPVLLFEKLGIFSSIGRSASLFKQTWGENLTAQFSTGGIFFLLGLLSIIPLAIAVVAGNVGFLLVMIVLFFLYLGVLIVLATSVNGILVAVLYRYAVTKKDPRVFEESVMSEMFR